MYPRTRSTQPELSLGLNSSRFGSRRTPGRTIRGRRIAKDLEELDGVGFNLVSRTQASATSSKTIFIEPIVEVDPGAFKIIENLRELSSTVGEPVTTQGFGAMSGSGGGAPAQAARVINPLVQPRGLPIVFPEGLAAHSVPPNLPVFTGSRDEDPSLHVERFIEILTTSLVSESGYYLVWFPNTLKDGAYAWYRNHAANTFADWNALQAAFLEEFQPEVGQSAALTALSSIRQGVEEDITAYIRRFEWVVDRFVGDLLDNDTLKHFFLQGFTNEKVIREILSSHPRDLAAAKLAARQVEQVNKEQERLWRREGDRIPSFIPIYAQNPSPSHPTPRLEAPIPVRYGSNPEQGRLGPPLIVQPLQVQTPVLALPERSWKDEMKKEIENAQKGFQDRMVQQMNQMTEQMAALMRNHNPNPPPPAIESGRHPSGLWCTTCGHPGHTSQFCQVQQAYQYQVQHQPQIQQLYVPPHRNQGYQPSNQGHNNQGRPRNEVHAFCGKKHPPGQCWVENQVVCGNCGGNHPTDVCRKPDKVIPLQTPPGNYPQQAVDQQRGARPQTQSNVMRPPNLYYDHNTNRQNHQAPHGVQTNVGFIPLNQHQGGSQNTQDVRFVGQPSGVEFGPPLPTSTVVIESVTTESNLITHSSSEDGGAMVAPSLAIMTRSMGPLPQVPEEELTSSTTDSPPRFSDMEKVAREAAKVAQEETGPHKFQPLFEDFPFPTANHGLEGNKDDWEGPRVPELERLVPQVSTINSPRGPYDLWADLSQIKANITIAQLLELSPGTRKLLKTRLPLRSRKKAKVMVAARVQPTTKIAEVKAVEVEAVIVDKVLPNTIVDGGSSLNIMPLQTMEKLGLSLTGPSPIVISMANQSPARPIGQIKDCQVMVGGESYTLTIHVIQTHSLRESFPLLLGRPWLRAAEAVVSWGGEKPHISFGPTHNRTKVKIRASQANFTIDSSDASEPDSPHVSHQLEFKKSELVSKASGVVESSTRCLGPSLYHWQGDEEFIQWLERYPDTDAEIMESVNCIEGLTLLGDVELEPNELGIVEASYAIDMDGTVAEDIEILNEEDELRPSLQFRKTSSGIIAGGDVIGYPRIPEDWYRGPIEQPHVRPSDWKYLDVSRDGEEIRNIKIGIELSDEEVAKYKALVMEYRDIFAWSYKDLQGIPPEVAQHRIPLIPGAIPIRQKERRMNPQLQLVVKVELEKLLQAGFIKPVEITDWVSPMVLVKKKNGKLRVCIDYRKLNKNTQKDHFPLPFINSILDEVAGHEMYTFMDGYSGYNQVSIAPEDRHKTAFTTPWGTFIFLVMPFGLCNAPSAFQRAMTYAFSDLLHKTMTVFIDDFSTQSEIATHLECVRQAFERCRRAGIALNPEKLFLAVLRGITLGYVVSKHGREPDPEKVAVITNLAPPVNVKGVERVLGHIGWYRELIPDYATRTIPITRLQRKMVKFEWADECEESFQWLKDRLSSYPVLRPPNWDAPFHVYCDASAVAVGSALCQPVGDAKKDFPIAFASKQLNAAEKNYTTTERECLAMVFSVKKFRHYLLLNPVVFFVDHMAIKYLVNKADLSGRIARWVLLLEEFDYTVEYKPGKMHHQADHLSRLSETLGVTPIEDNLVDETLFTIASQPKWYNHIAEFLATQQLPEELSHHERRKVRVNSRYFAIVGNRLYRRGVDGLLRRCVVEEEVSKILEACHDSACGGHFAGRLTAQKALRAGYFWPTMFQDAHDYVKRCDACQRYAKNDLHMAMPLHVSLPLAPFEKWGIDYIGEVHPNSSRGMKHIIVATEYLTKWAEAKAVKANDAVHAANFLFEQVITRFGCPKILISDRGTHFLNTVIESMTKRFDINHRMTTPYHPQTNGNTERVNQTLVNILRKTVQDSKRDWDTKLPAALWAYRTTYKVTTKATPFSLVYGVESILPIEFEVQSLRIAVNERLTMAPSLVERLLMLESLDEVRRASAQHVEAIQRRRKLAFDKRHKKRSLVPGMLVMLQDARKIDFPGKFDAVWMGPYMIVEAYPNNSVQLQTLNGEVFPTRTSGNRCKEYKV